jgi:hypothetical protein
MQKLIIQDIAQINAQWYAIRFDGLERRLHAMTVFLAQQTNANAYWDETGLYGKGAWIVRLDLLKRLTTRFENIERAIIIAERVAALKQINMLARRR